MEKTTRRVTSVVSFVLALLTVLTSCNVSLLTGAALTTQVDDVTELIVNSESVKLSSEGNAPLDVDEWITYEASLYNSYTPVLLSDDVAGDINGDGRTTVVDTVALLQYLAGGDVACVYNAMDVNGDKQINKQDVGALIKYIVGFTKTANMQPACDHNFTAPKSLAVTCDVDGVREHYECSICRVKFSDSQGSVAVTDKYLAIKSTGHKRVVIPAEPATCAEAGKTSEVKCKICSEVLEAAQDTEPTGIHTYIDPISEIKATVTTTGMTAGTRCSVCGEIGVKPIITPALGTAELIYELTGDYYTVKGLEESCTAAVIIIPAAYKEKPVKAIAPGAFANRKHITEVIILSYESSATIKPKGPEILASGGVTEIGEGAFSGCTGLTDVDMGNCVENISNDAFSGCSSLESVNISDNVANIGDGSFNGCSNLETVTLPGTVEKIGESAFADCGKLDSLDYQGTKEEWDDVTKNNIWGENKEVKVSYYSEGLLMELGTDGTYYIVAGIGSCKDTELKIPAEYNGIPVTHIKESAFQNNTTITSVFIPKSITFIGKAAFSGATALAKVNITDLAAWCSISFESINANPLYFANNLYLNDKLVTDLVIGNEIESISNYAFSKCNIQTVSIGNGVKRIGSRAFEQCDSLTEIVIPDNVTTLSSSTFSGCDNLTTAHVGNGIKLLSAYTFRNCSKLATVTLGSNINRFGAGVFYGCTALTSVNIPAGVTRFYGECFYNCSSLASIELPKGLKTIGDKTFSGCSSLAAIVIPDNVIEIGANAFSACTALSKVTVGSGVETIGENAFADSVSISEVHIKDLVAWCDISFVGEKSNPLCANNDGKPHALYVNGALLTELRVPAGVTSISNYAFRGNTALKTVIIPEGVTHIGAAAFANCPALQYVELPASIQTLGEQVFAYDSSIQKIIYRGTAAGWHKAQKANWSDECSIAAPTIYSVGLELTENDNGYTVTGLGNCVDANVTVPEYYNGKRVTAIAAKAFNGATNITSVIIPASVTSIGTGVFAGCTNLSSITVAGGNPVYISLGNCLIEAASRTLLAGCKTSVIPNDGSVTSIANAAFLDCASLTVIVIPDNVLIIGAEAFKNCKNLKGVLLGNTLAAIGDSAFAHCESLSSVSIPTSVKIIGTEAFSSCRSLKEIIYCGTPKEWETVSKGEGWILNTDSTVTCEKEDIHVHEEIKIEGKLPTCTEAGLSEGSKCSSCGETVVEQIVLPALGHTEVVDKAVEPTCTATGLSEGKHCSACNAVLVKQETVPAKGHKYGSVVTEPTCKDKGYTTYTCTVCGNSYTGDEKNALGHTPAEKVYENVVGATCGQSGTYDEVTYCKVCKVEIERIKGVVVPATGEHNYLSEVKDKYVAPTCTEKGKRVYACSCGAEKTEDVSAAGHKEVKDAAVAPTCTATGLTEGKHCSVCKAVLVKQESVPTKSHTEAVDKAVAPTCTATGLTEGKHCSVCKKVLKAQESVPATGHTEVVDKAVAPTCTATGLTEGKHCSVCKAVLVKQESLSATGHTEVVDKAVAPTCTESGLTEGKHCSVCNTTIVAQEVLPAEHKEVIDAAVAPTCTKSGLTEGKHCSVCKKVFVKQEEVPSPGHISEKWTVVTQPTSTTAGYKTGVCKNCSEEVAVIIPALGSEGLVYKLNADGTSYSLAGIGTCKDTEIVIATTIKDMPVTAIAANAFNSNKNITGVIMSDSIVTIEYRAFYNCAKLKTLHLSKSLKTIGDQAFRNCSAITSVSIPSSVTTIGEWAFAQTGIKTIELPAKLKMLDVAVFEFCENLSSVSFGSQLTSIGSSAFRGTALKSVILPANVTTINNYAFAQCDNLIEVIIPAKVKTINQGAFSDCASLTSIVVAPENVNFKVIDNCLINVTNKTLVAAINGFVIPADGSVTSIQAAALRGLSMTEVTIPDTVTNIGPYVFQNCTSLVRVHIGSGVTAIAGQQFTNCSALVSLTVSPENATYYSVDNCVINRSTKTLVLGCSTSVIPKDGSVTAIGNNAFYGITNMTSISIPDGITSIGDSAFNSVTNMTAISIPDSVTYIGTNAFYNAFQLASINIPSGVTVIDSYAFYGCKALKEIIIPESVTAINAYAFYNCSSLSSINIPSGVTVIDSYVFYGCSSLTKIVLPAGVTTIKTRAFYNCSSLSSINIPSGVTVIDSRTFYGCKALTEVVIPDGVTAINDYAFYNCSGLVSVVIPKTVTSFGISAFANCTKLANIWFEGTQEQWNAITKGKNWNLGCKATIRIMVAADGHTHDKTKLDAVAPTCTKDGLAEGLKCSACGEVLLAQKKVYALGHKIENWTVATEPTDKTAGSKTGVCQVCFEEVSETIPPFGSVGLDYELNADGTAYTLTGIGTCTDTEIVIATTINDIPVTAIAAKAFSGNTTITRVVMSNTITTIGDYVFDGCSTLTTVYFGNNLKTIGKSAFRTTAVNNISLPANLVTISGYAFAECNNLTEINIPAKVTEVGTGAFSDCASLVSITVDPTNATYVVVDNCLINTKTKSLVAAVNGFVIPSDGSVTTITTSALRGLDMVEVIIPDAITSLGNMLFDNCTSLKSVHLGSGVSRIVSSCFDNCPELISLTVSSENATYYSVDNCIIERNSNTLVRGCATSIIPSDGSVTSIGTHAFSGGLDITSISIPNCITSIGTYAFNKASKLANIWFEGTQEQWNTIVKGENWNLGCKATIRIMVAADGHTHDQTKFDAVAPTCTKTGLTEGLGCSVCGLKFVEPAVVPATGHTFGEWAVDKQPDKTNDGSKHTTCTVCSETITTSIPYIGSQGLAYTLNKDQKTYSVSGMGECTDTELVIPKVYMDMPVTAIAEYAFTGNTTITSIFIPGSITQIYRDAFSKCTSLTAVYTDDIVAWCQRVYSSATANPTYVKAKLYVNNVLLTDLVIPDAVTKISNFAFANCTQLNTVVFPDTLISIGGGAFSGCQGIKSITLPESLTYIGDMALQVCEFTEIHIPANVSTIGISAFNDVPLEKITVDENNKDYFASGNCLIEKATKKLIKGCANSVIPSDGSVTIIGEGAFMECDTLTGIVIPEGVTIIENRAFAICDVLESVSLPNSLVTIGENAFARCKQIKELTIPDGVTGIGAYAFDTCSKLVSINLPSGLTTISDRTFQNCSGLTSITIPNSVKSIGDGAFLGCSGISTFKYEGTSAEWETVAKADNWMNNCTFTVTFTKGEDGHTHDQTKVDAVAPTCTNTGLTEGLKCSVCGEIFTAQVELPATGHTEVIDAAVASTCTTTGLTEGKHCSVCNEVLVAQEVVPASHTEVIDAAVAPTCTTTGLTEGKHCSVCNEVLLVQEIVPVIGHSEGEWVVDKAATKDEAGSKHQVCAACGETIKTDVIPATGYSVGLEYTLNSDGESYSVTKIGTCTDIDVVIPSVYENLPVTGIGKVAFYNCETLNSVYLPDSISDIGLSAFYRCTALTSINVPNGVADIKDETFYFCLNLMEITLPSSIISIGQQAFAYCTSLTSITIPDNVENIDASAFRECTALESVNVPSRVSTLGASVFNGCTNLSNAIIEDGVECIGDNAFWGCSKLTAIDIPQSVVSIGENVFADCTGLAEITVNSGNSVYHSEGNCLIETATKTLIAGCKSSVIPTNGSVTTIKNHAFRGCTGLTTLDIPNSVTSIGSYAFYNCSSLTSVTIPTGVTTINDKTFYGCSALESVTIPDSVTQIKTEAFYNCKGLTSVTIPKSVKVIGENAFNGSSIKEVYYTGTEAEWSAVEIVGAYNGLLTVTVHYNS